MKQFILILCFISLSVSGRLPAQIKIGVALPLMKDAGSETSGSTGEMMLKGISDALTEYDANVPLSKVEIVVEDTKRDPQTTLDILNKFGSDSKISAVLGPVFSSELSMTAGAASFHKMPVITPSATENFIAEKNEYVFQLNPTYDIRGRLMAKYAGDKLKMRKFIILAENTYGKMFADAFEDQANEDGDSILFVKYYSKDDWDLLEEVREIKNYLSSIDKFISFADLPKAEYDKLVSSGLNSAMIDTLITGKYFVSIYRLFGTDAESVVSARSIPTKPLDTESLKVLFGVADAIYIPVSKSDEVGRVALALFRNSLDLPVLGTSDWNNRKVLEDNSVFLPEVVYEADFLLSKEFDDKASELTDLKDADLRNYFFGYGSMRMLLSIIANGNKSRSDINRAVESLSGYVAPYNKYSMKKRTNVSLNIVKFSNGKYSYLSYTL